MIRFHDVAAEYAARAERAAEFDDPVRWIADHTDGFLWSKQREVVRSVVEHRRTLVASCHASGKALTPDTPVLTTDGWTTMGEVREGDHVFDEEGHPTRVVAVRTWTRRPVYRVWFDEGAYIDADANHEWAVAPVTDLPDTSPGWEETGLMTTAGLFLGCLAPGRRYVVPAGGGPDSYHVVTGVEYLREGPTVCIEVDSPRHLYLAGRALIPTHNSFIASRIAAWWLGTRPNDPTETRVVTTAPSWPQVKNIMWAYLEDVQGKADLPGRITEKAEWKMPGFKSPTAFGRKPADYDESSFQGIHSTYVLAIIDEAGGVPENIFTSIETITTNRHARVLAIANPDDPTSYMAKVWRDQERLPEDQRDWNLITISAFDTPNFTGEDVPEKIRDNLLQRGWVEDARRRWGEDDPRYAAKVLAKFPDIGSDGLFNLGRVLQAMNTYDTFEVDEDAPVHLGVDVGLSESGDFSVIAANRGGKVEVLEKVKGYDGNRLARLIGDYARMLRPASIRIDAVGVGRGVQSVLGNHVPEDVPVYWIVGNAKSPDHIKWYNFRAAMYDNLSTLINTGEVVVPPDEYAPGKTDGLYDEFRTIKVEYRGTSMLIQGKDQIRKMRLSGKNAHSPDVLDAIAYACITEDLLNGGTDRAEDVTTDMIMESTQSYEAAADEWGNEEWSFAPA